MKWVKTVKWCLEKDTRVATITKHHDTKEYFWTVETRVLDFGFGHTSEWKILSCGKEDALTSAKSAVKKMLRGA